MKITSSLLPALLCLAAVQAPAGAQANSQPEEFSDRIDVKEVLLDVLVTDRGGNVIVGLDEKDFIVEEEGVVVKVTGSTFYSNRRLVESSQAAAALGAAPNAVPEDRYFIFFLHDQRITLPRLTAKYLDLARRTENWIRTELLPNDWVAVVRYDFKLKIHSDFTRDNERLVKAVNDAARGKNPPDIWPSRMEENESDGPSLLAHLATGKELRRQTTRIYSGLEVLADAVGDIVGRKNLLFFSAGFGDNTGLGTILPDVRYYDNTMQALNDSNVAVYSISVLTGIDFAGLGISNTNSLHDSMNMLSNDTGGRYFFNHVSFSSPLETVLAENNGYYLLSYRSETPAGASGYRKVSVKAKNPEFKVRAREGYRFGA